MRVNLPIALTLTRLLLVPVFVLMVISGRFLAGLAIFVVAGVTDVLDGWVARRMALSSRVGAVLDPLADKLLVASAYVALTVVPGRVAVPVWLTLVVMARDVLIGLVALVLFLRTGRKEFRPSRLGKATMAAQWAFIVYVLAANALAIPAGPLPALVAATALITLASGASYALHVFDGAGQDAPAKGS